MSAAAPARERVVRLDSIGRPGTRLSQPGAAARRQQNRKSKKCCDNPQIDEQDDGSKICQNCWTLISEQNITAELTFEDNPNGGASVQGGFVGDTARHARTLGSAAYRRVGGVQRESMEQIHENGKRVLARLCPRLQIFEKVRNQAQNIWGLAAKHNFTAGRRTEEVVGACLYAACRRQSDNAILLIDISELLKINVFRLGEVYKDLCRTLYMGDDSAGNQYQIDVEPLILKYCQKLEFGTMTKQVAEDAVRIIRRMKRDWIYTGRHPAGLCGACIILAARMNNFRRAVREIVYIAKISDFTVGKRLEEFKRTRSSALTVDQFRTVGHRLKHQHDPPVIYERKLKEQKMEAKKRKRQQAEPIDISEDGSNASSRASSAVQSPAPEKPTSGEAPRKRKRTLTVEQTPPSTQQEPRRDADGFAIPALPIDPALTGTPAAAEAAQPPKRRRGRPRKTEQPVVQFTAEDLAAEDELEREIEVALADPRTNESQDEVWRAKAEERAKVLAQEQKVIGAEAAKVRREKLGITWCDSRAAVDGEQIEDDLAAEFADDPEVQNCLLSEEERCNKEKIWVTFNEQWLREEQLKELERELKKAESSKAHGAKAGKGGKKKRGRMGDGSLLGDAETPAETPADAMLAMVEKRAASAFSKHLNYDFLKGIYGSGKSSTGSPGSNDAPRSASLQPDAHSTDATPVTTPGSEAGSPAPASRTASDLLSPPPTQQIAPVAARPAPEPPRQATPEPTQQEPEPTAGAQEEDDDDDEEEELEDEENEFMTGGMGADDDYDDAMNPMGESAFGHFGGEDEFGEDEGGEFE